MGQRRALGLLAMGAASALLVACWADFPAERFNRSDSGPALDQAPGESPPSDAVADGPAADGPAADGPVADGPADGPITDVVADAAVDGSVDAPPADATVDVLPPDLLAPDMCVNADNDSYSLCAGDCDDNDPLVHPGQLAFSTVPRQSGGFDFNCDLSEEKEFPNVVQCTGTGANCQGSGWVGTVPDCGQPGDFSSCVFKSGNCAPQPSATKVQACR